MPKLFVVLSFISGFATLGVLLMPMGVPKSVVSRLSMREYYNQKKNVAAIMTQTLSAKKNKANTSFASISVAPSVLGESTPSAVKKVEPQQNPDPVTGAEATFKNKPQKSTYTIAVLGDSMVDTLGPGVPHLSQELKKAYPTISFTVLNYGVGASNIEYGITRLTNGYTYLEETKPALLSTNPDIVVVESFAYNHWDNSQSDLDRHWLAINKIIETIKNHNSNTKIILSSSIAPHCATYTDGSANLPPERKFKECETVKAYLQNMVNFATSQSYPLADAYHASLSGSDGQEKYINAGDHIHPSDAGKLLFAQKVAEQVKKLL